METPPPMPPMGWCMVWWVSGWLESGQMIQNQISLDFFSGQFLDILLKPLQPFTGLFLMKTIGQYGVTCVVLLKSFVYLKGKLGLILGNSCINSMLWTFCDSTLL